MKHFNQILLGLTLGGAALYFTLRNVSFSQLWVSFGEVQYLYLIPVSVVSFFILFLRACRWKVLISPMCNTKASNLISPIAIGQLGNMLPLRAGEILRGYLLTKKIQISFTSSLATIMIERVFDIMMLLILMIWIFAFQPNFFDSNFKIVGKPLDSIALGVGITLTFILICLVLVIILLTFWSQWKRPMEKLIVLILPSSWQCKLRPLIRNFILGLDMVKNPKHLFLVAIYSLMIWTLATFSYYFYFIAFNLAEPAVSTLIIMEILIPIFMTALPAPGFLGSIQAAIFLVLHEILGEPAVIAAAFGMVAWAWGLLTQLCFGFFFIFKEHFQIKEMIKFKERGAEEL
jgi:glycosyltransferase 2 family protein